MAFIITPQLIRVTCAFDGASATITSDHPRFKEAKAWLEENFDADDLALYTQMCVYLAGKVEEAEAIRVPLDEQKRRVSEVFSAGTITNAIFTSDDLYLGDFLGNKRKVPKSILHKLLSLAEAGSDNELRVLVKFTERLVNCQSSFTITQRLMAFLETHEMPITTTGKFLAYKVVRQDYKDIYTGTISNHVGAVIKVPRSEVDDDMLQTCSNGLHVCSKAYLPHFGVQRDTTHRVVICEVAPSDVVAIPTDYNDSKMRVCAYTVVGEVKNPRTADWLGVESSAPAVVEAARGPVNVVRRGEDVEDLAEGEELLSPYSFDDEGEVEGYVWEYDDEPDAEESTVPAVTTSQAQRPLFVQDPYDPEAFYVATPLERQMDLPFYTMVVDKNGKKHYHPYEPD